MKVRGTQMMLRMIIIVFIPLFLFPGGAYPALEDNGGVSAMIKMTESDKNIPPIDTLIPDKIETATFAMG